MDVPFLESCYPCEVDGKSVIFGDVFCGIEFDDSAGGYVDDAKAVADVRGDVVRGRVFFGSCHALIV